MKEKNQNPEEPSQDLTQFIDVAVSDDSMKAFLTFNLPKSISENITSQMIYQVLNRKEVTFGIYTDRINKAVADFNKNKAPVDNLLIAEGLNEVMATPAIVKMNKAFTVETHIVKKLIKKVPRKAEPRQVSAIGRLKGLIIKPKKEQDYIEVEVNKKFHVKKTNSVLKADTLIAEVTLPEEGKEGKTVTGKLVWSPGNKKNVKELILIEGKNVIKKEYGNLTRYFCQYPGIVQLVDNRLLELEIVLDSGFLINIKKGNKAAFLILKGPRGKGEKFSLEAICKELDVKRLAYKDYIQDIEKHVEDLNSRSTGEQLDILVAEQIAPVNGGGGYLKFCIEINSKKKAGTTEKIDHRVKNSLALVEKGATIAEIVPPTEGKKCGYDIFGKEIQPLSGKKYNLELTENIYIDNNLVKSKCSGYVFLKDETIHVIPTLILKGDVNLSTGNIRFNNDLIIKGNVTDEFIVEVDGNIDIGGSVEAAFVKAKGDIRINGGVFGKSKGKIEAEGNITVKFSENALLEAGDEITISNYSLLSTLKSKNQIKIGDGKKGAKKGTVVGGHLMAFNRIAVNNAGSEKSGNNTHITLGFDYTVVKKLKEMKNTITEIQFKIMSITYKINYEKDPAVLEKEKNENEKLKSELNKIIKTQQDLMTKLENKNPDGVYISGSIFPGNRLQILDSTKLIDKTYNKTAFVFDMDRQRIITRNLK